jgi:hypothetical protein
LIEEEDRKDDPADRKETIGCTEAGRQECHLWWHLKDRERNDQCCNHARQSGKMSLDSQASHGHQQNKERERG